VQRTVTEHAQLREVPACGEVAGAMSGGSRRHDAQPPIVESRRTAELPLGCDLRRAFATKRSLASMFPRASLTAQPR
jgi:hypothetical protein